MNQSKGASSLMNIIVTCVVSIIIGWVLGDIKEGPVNQANAGSEIRREFAAADSVINDKISSLKAERSEDRALIGAIEKRFDRFEDKIDQVLLLNKINPDNIK